MPAGDHLDCYSSCNVGINKGENIYIYIIGGNKVEELTNEDYRYLRPYNTMRFVTPGFFSRVFTSGFFFSRIFTRVFGS